MKNRPAYLAAAAAIVGPALAMSGAAAQTAVPLKEAKLNIEHNATDLDTGFQGAIDSEGWSSIIVRGPNGDVLEFEGEGKLATLGLTELFFETVEPANEDVPIKQMLSNLPAGNYRMSGPIPANQGGGVTSGTAWLTHTIPRGPLLVSPAPSAVVPPSDLLVSWNPVTKSITGGPVKIIAYQLIIEKDAPVHPHMIGKQNSLSMYLSPTVTQISIPASFFSPNTPYVWEVLAIEESGNQTLSSGDFSTF